MQELSGLTGVGILVLFCILTIQAKNYVGALLPQTVGLEDYSSNTHRINKI